MAFQFPAAPTIGQIFTPVAGVQYKWNGYAWDSISLSALSKAQADLLYISLTSTGAVLQEVLANDGGGVTTSTTLVNVNTANITITPKSITSKLLVEVTTLYSTPVTAGSNILCDLVLYDVDAAALVGNTYVVGPSVSAGGIGFTAPVVVRAIVPNAVLTARRFQLRGKTSNAAAALTVSNSVWSIREIHN